MDGSNVTQLSTSQIAVHPNCSPDGKFVVYVNVVGNTTRLMKVGIDGGTASEISKADAFSPVISPDGASLAALYQPDRSKHPSLAVIGIERAAKCAAFTTCRWKRETAISGDGGQKLAWINDGHAILYPVNSDGVVTLWAQPVGPQGSPAAPRKTSDEPRIGFPMGRVHLVS